MTLTDELNQDMLKMYLYIKMQFLGQGFQKCEHDQDRQTDVQTRPNALPRCILGWQQAERKLDITLHK